VNVVNATYDDDQDGEADSKCYPGILPHVDAFMRFYAYTEHATAVPEVFSVITISKRNTIISLSLFFYINSRTPIKLKVKVEYSSS